MVRDHEQFIDWWSYTSGFGGTRDEFLEVYKPLYSDCRMLDAIYPTNRLIIPAVRWSPRQLFPILRERVRDRKKIITEAIAKCPIGTEITVQEGPETRQVTRILNGLKDLEETDYLEYVIKRHFKPFRAILGRQ